MHHATHNPSPKTQPIVQPKNTALHTRNLGCEEHHGEVVKNACLYQSLENCILFNDQHTLGMCGIQRVLLQQGDVTRNGQSCVYGECRGVMCSTARACGVCSGYKPEQNSKPCTYMYCLPAHTILSLPCLSSMVPQSCQQPAAGSYTRRHPAATPLLLQQMPRLLRGTCSRATAS